MAEVGLLGLRSLGSVTTPVGIKQVDLRPDNEASTRKPAPVEEAEKEQPLSQFVEREEVERVAKKIQESIRAVPVSLRVVVENGYYVFELVDSESGDVIRRIPPSWFRIDSAEYGHEPQSDDNRMPSGVLVDRNG